jgi:uncharacterized protein
MNKIEVGKVSELWVYPVKSMKGVQMGEVSVRSVSVVGDRRVAFHYTDKRKVPSALESIFLPELLLYQPYFIEPSEPGDSQIFVKTPEGMHLNADGDELLKELTEKLGQGLNWAALGRGSYHSTSVSLATLASIRLNGEEAGGLKTDGRRFRENILVDGLGDTSYAEMGWLGNVIHFGEQDDRGKLIGLKPDKRCKTVGYHPDTLEYTSAFDEATIRNHNHFLGIYGSVAKEGKVRVGDKIYISKSL